MLDVCAFGHITRESEEWYGHRREFIAGPPYFFSIALKRLGNSVMVITKLNPKDKYLLAELEKEGIPIVLKESSRTSSFHTIYGKSLDERIIKVISVADPFTLDDLVCCQAARYIYLGPLTIRDFDLEFLIEARKKAPLILDVQGFTRRVVGDKIEYVDWDWKHEGIKYVDIFKADSREARILTGLDNVVDALKKLLEWGVKEVLITSNKGVYLGVKGLKIFFAPFIVDKIQGRVGRGDTCTAAYTHARLRGMDYKEAIIFAAAATSLKLGYQGPLKNDEKDVMKYISERYRGIDPKIE
ncbi:MAG: hypothetical protein DRO16_00470 [Thermoprotei archaeon]|nr:MAG: hypothetical protein DRO16_00470 [Thermoprotei archaeon]